VGGWVGVWGWCWGGGGGGGGGTDKCAGERESTRERILAKKGAFHQAGKCVGSQMKKGCMRVCVCVCMCACLCVCVSQESVDGFG